jgi:hypothetical protein
LSITWEIYLRRERNWRNEDEEGTTGIDPSGVGTFPAFLARQMFNRGFFSLAITIIHIKEARSEYACHYKYDTKAKRGRNSPLCPNFAGIAA